MALPARIRPPRVLLTALQALSEGPRRPGPQRRVVPRRARPSLTLGARAALQPEPQGPSSPQGPFPPAAPRPARSAPSPRSSPRGAPSRCPVQGGVQPPGPWPWPQQRAEDDRVSSASPLSSRWGHLTRVPSPLLCGGGAFSSVSLAPGQSVARLPLGAASGRGLSARRVSLGRRGQRPRSAPLGSSWGNEAPRGTLSAGTRIPKRPVPGPPRRLPPSAQQGTSRGSAARDSEPAPPAASTSARRGSVAPAGLLLPRGLGAPSPGTWGS